MSSALYGGGAQRFTRASIRRARRVIADNRTEGTARRPRNSIRAQLVMTSDMLERACDEIERLREVK